MASAEQELKSLFVAEHSRPCEGCVPFQIWVGIPHIRSLDEAFDEEKVIVWKKTSFWRARR